MAPIDFDYDLEKIVQMDGVGPISLKSALKSPAGVGLAAQNAANRIWPLVN
jgi:hypothetical protein